jgi:uncharacterized protein YndB with AHSA1/START domain
MSKVAKRPKHKPGSRVRESIVIDAPPQEVWRVIADPRNLPRWNPHIAAVHGVPDEGLKPGTRYQSELRFVGAHAKVDAEVIELEPGRYSEIELSGPVWATVRTFLRPIGKHQTRVEHEVEYRFRGGPIGGVVARVVRLLGAPTLLRRGLRAQKVQREEG